MLLPDQMLPFLNHEDPDVRRLAVKYFDELADASPPETAEELWRALDSYGKTTGLFGVPEQNPMLLALAQLPQNDVSTARAIELLKNTGLNDVNRYFVFGYFTKMPVDLLDRHREHILPFIDDAARKILEHRLSLRALTGEQLWQELMDHSIRAVEAENYRSVDAAGAGRIAEALHTHPEIAIPRAMEILQDPQDRYWLETWCIGLLGDLRHNPATDLILNQMMSDDGDFKHPVAGRALARMDPHQTVSKIEARYDEKENYVRMRVPESLGKNKHPLAEAALIRLLAGETDPQAVSCICGALVDLCTTNGLDAMRQVIIENRYDSSFGDVMEELVCLAKVTGIHPPELEQWTREVNDKNRQRKKRRDFLAKMGMTEAQAELLRGLAEGKSAKELTKQKSLAAAAIGQDATMPIRRESPKIGRNDPCPCGNGKKYKKCCGK
jgi:hypothetical protein